MLITKVINDIDCIEANGSINVNDKYYPVPYALVRMITVYGLPQDKKMKYVKFINGNEHCYDIFNLEWTDEPPIDKYTKKLYDDAWYNVINKRKMWKI